MVSCTRIWAALMLGTAFDNPLGQAGGKPGIWLDWLDFGKVDREQPKIYTGSKKSTGCTCDLVASTRS